MNTSPLFATDLPLTSELTETTVLVRKGSRFLATFRLATQGGAAVLALDEFSSLDEDIAPEVLRDALRVLFCHRRDLGEVNVDVGSQEDLARRLDRRGLIFGPKLGSDRYGGICRRSVFFQHREPWLTQEPSAGYPLSYVLSHGRRHPRRPPIALGTVYRRKTTESGPTVSFRTIDPSDHLELFHRWMNEPRVAVFWELAGSQEEHADYLAKTLADPHVHPLVGFFDEQPFGYFEAYWAKEDRIAPFYDVDDYDRGIHMLVGEKSQRGPHRVGAWLPSLVHYLFLDDPRTRNVVAEPRADNARMIDYLKRTGFFKTKEFDFPHKRAAMMILPRETFFDQFCP